MKVCGCFHFLTDIIVCECVHLLFKKFKEVSLQSVTWLLFVEVVVRLILSLTRLKNLSLTGIFASLHAMLTTHSSRSLLSKAR